MPVNPQTYFPKVPAVPNMPLAPTEWDRRYQDQFTNILRLYLNQLSGFASALMGKQGGRFIDYPCGSFYDLTTQTAANTTTAYPMTLGNTSFSNGVGVTSGSHIRVSQPGLYNLQFSVQLVNATNSVQDIDIWFRKNGVDIPDSNSRFGLAPEKNATIPYHTVSALNLFVDLGAGDYVEIVWCTTSTSAYISTYAAGTSPTRPAVPSIITTMAFVSAPL
jgi:hypothetical protein